jgi:hypothetical protein
MAHVVTGGRNVKGENVEGRQHVADARQVQQRVHGPYDLSRVHGVVVGHVDVERAHELEEAAHLVGIEANHEVDARVLGEKRNRYHWQRVPLQHLQQPPILNTLHRWGACMWATPWHTPLCTALLVLGQIPYDR